MKRDQQLVLGFLAALNQNNGTSFKVVRWPDDENRQTPAIEAVASDSSGNSLAIEHTLIQPFEGERDDTERFMRVFGPLEGCSELMKPGHNVNVNVTVGAIPKGVKWEKVADRVREYLAEIIPTFGAVDKVVSIPGLTFPLPISLGIETHDAGNADHVWVSRSDVPKSFKQVVKTALERKLPKLVAEKANRRILLLEKADIAHGHLDARVAIDDLTPEFPELGQIDEIWLAVTTCWETEGVLFFYEIVPEAMGRKLKINWSRPIPAASGA